MTYNEAVQCVPNNTPVLFDGATYYIDHVEGNGDAWMRDGASLRFDGAKVVDVHVHCSALEVAP